MTAMTAAAQAEFDTRAHRREERRRLLWIIAGTVFLFIYPFIDSGLGINRLGSWIPIFVFVILAMGLNIVTGYAGLLDLGYVAFFVIGAYSNALLTSPNSVLVRNDLVPAPFTAFWPAMLLSWVVAAIFGVLLGAPTLRLRGDYLAIVTLGFGEIVPSFVTNVGSLTGGPRGIGQIAGPTTIPLPGDNELSFSTLDQRNWFWLIVIVGLFSLFIITRLHDSRLGRAWQAVREDELAAASMGVNLVRTKLWAFGLGASFSGFAGAVYAGYIGVVYPDQFRFSVSVIILSMVILGGIGNIYGVIAGGIIIGAFDRILTEELNVPLNWFGEQIGSTLLAEHNLSTHRFLIFGLSLVLIMVLRPGGLFPDRRRAAELRPETDDISGPAQEELYDVRAENEALAGERR